MKKKRDVDSDYEQINADEGYEEENEKTSLAPVQESYFRDITVPDNKEKTDRYYEIFNKDKPKKMIWSIVSVVLAISSVVCCFFGWIGLIIGVIAVGFSLISRYSLKYFDMLSIIGLIVGIFGIVFGSVCFAWAIVFGEGIIESIFFGNFLE